MLRCKYLFLFVFLLSSFANAKSRDPLEVDLPGLEVIPGAQWYWVGQHMALNNIPMSIRMFSYPGEKEKVEKFYLSRWQTKGHGKLSKRNVGDLKILTYELDGFLYSVQFAQKGSVVEGKLAVSPTPLHYTSNVKSILPLAPSSKVASKVESLENGRRTETLTIDSKLPWRQLETYYVNQFTNDDWVMSSRSENRVGSVTSFQRGGELLQLTIKGLQGRNSSFSQALLHWLK
ncbi:hypothetical protein FT643_10310 [Ketobacter sp. MCCC 1A13808]|uniref:hypothetical protein n=1 Tax=Ketobacter sp. MCCC 1A13808 TaxID=2602738 RepID=UPI0012EB673E|nr:hypothetical protein [Ketobacter sp. MCCC 1A13808]MVF12533.1 hypothetical protein [Ketobacter sp. MCCC 1A13808]